MEYEQRAVYAINRCWYKNLDSIVNLIIQHNVSVKKSICGDSLEGHFLKAVKPGDDIYADTYRMRFILRYGPKLIHYTASKGDPELFFSLFDKRVAPLDIPDQSGYLPIVYAILYPKFVERLLSEGVSIESESKTFVDHIYCMFDYAEEEAKRAASLINYDNIIESIVLCLKNFKEKTIESAHKLIYRAACIDKRIINELVLLSPKVIDQTAQFTVNPLLHAFNCFKLRMSNDGWFYTEQAMHFREAIIELNTLVGSSHKIDLTSIESKPFYAYMGGISSGSGNPPQLYIIKCNDDTMESQF